MRDNPIEASKGYQAPVVNAKFINASPDGIQAETIESFQQNQYYYSIVKPAIDPMNGERNKQLSIKVDPSHYNLIVIDYSFSGYGTISIQPELALTKSITPNLKERLSKLSNAAISELKKYPTIVCKINEKQAAAGDSQYALYGMITDIKKSSSAIYIDFHYINTISQQKLNDISEKLQLDGTTYSNELNTIHWTIKKVNIIDLFTNENINIMIPNILHSKDGE